ncbi:MAG: biotin synthase BioB [Kiritimatiellia bacterium]
MKAPFYTREEIVAKASGSEKELFAEAEALTRTQASRHFDRCSIVNGKCGHCSEDCKWCAQSAHYSAECDAHPLISEAECLFHARANEAQGIRRFSIVNSGRKASDEEIEILCDRFRMLRRETKLELCASLGLLDEAALQKLYAAGVTRYHCNLETSPKHFSALCSTHTQAEKLATLAAAQRVGMELCSGGIIGMGETETDRIDLALALRALAISSIPLNILSPIQGTPLASTPLLSEHDILRAVALFRLVHPSAYLRFAGGRARLSSDTLEAALRLGINSAIEGDLLTTLGNTVAQDKAHVIASGYTV